MGRYSGKACRLLTMLGLTASFFLVEIIVGYVTNSIALVADSFHMLSDVVALIVGFASVRISKWKSPKNTFGWARAEVVGALVNAVFLVALCFSITIEALKRLVQVEEIENPKLMLIVGGAGLGINIIGLFLFHNHGHSHGGGGHGHSHGGGGHGHNHEEEEDHSHGREMEALVDDTTKANGNIVSEDTSCLEKTEVIIEIDDGKVASSSQLNMRGVFLHVLGDALGSVIVVISALVIWFVEDEWKYYVDPAMSLMMVVIIVCTTIPLLRESSCILLQTVPSHILVSDIKEKLVKVPGVIALHELHVWQLAGHKLIASVHVQCQCMIEYNNTIARQIKEIFHNEGIHSTTIQPEIVNEQDPDTNCAFECGPDKKCYQHTCCAERVKKSNNKDSLIKRNGSARTSPQNESKPTTESRSSV